MSDDDTNAEAEATPKVDLKNHTITLPMGTVALVVSAFLGAGGTAGLQQMLGGNNEKVIGQIELLERRLEQVESVQSGVKQTVNATFDIVNAAHPPRGRVGVPDPNPE